MTLHEAIKNVLLNFGRLSVKDLTDKINWHRAYRRKDGQPLNTSQVSARISKYPELFAFDENNKVILRNYALLCLKLTIDKIAECIHRNSSNNDYASELLLPTFAVYLKYSDPALLFIDVEKTGAISPESYIQNLIEDLNKLNKSEKFKDLLTRQIDYYSNLDFQFKWAILSSIFEEYLKLRKSKYFTERKTSYEYEKFEDYMFDEESINDILISTEEYGNRLTEYSSRNISEYEFKEYFNKLINEYSWKRKFRSLGSTPLSIARLISKVVGCEELTEGETYTIFDPFFGKGSLVAEICLQNYTRKFTIIGGDLNENAILISYLLFAVNELPKPELVQANAFIDWQRESSFSDWFITDPPMIQKISNDVSQFEGYGISKNAVEKIINMALFHTHEYGKACIVVPESFIFSSNKSTMALRKKLIENNYLDGIISLPAGLYNPYSSVKTSLIILDKSRFPKNDRIFVFDAGALNPDELDTIIPEIEAKYAAKRNEDFLNHECFIKKEKIVNQNYDFSVQKLTLPLFVESPLLNYVTIEELLPIMASEREMGSVRVLSGNSVSKEEITSSGGIPYIQISDLNNDPYPYFINESKIKTFVANTDSIRPRFIKKGAVLVSKSGNALKATIYNGSAEILFSPAILSFKIDETKIIPEFFIHQLYKDYFKEQLKKIRRGSTILSFKPEDFLKLLVYLPPIEEQEKILSEIQKSKLNKTFNKDEISNLIGELKHKAKGPLGGIKASVKRLENYVKRKQNSGEGISSQDIAYNLLPGQLTEDYKHYSLEETFKRFYLHIDRIDDYLKKAIKFAMLGEENSTSETINLYELITKIVIPSNHYNFQILVDDISTNKNVKVSADKDRLLSVFELLLDNAFIHGFKMDPNSDSKVNVSWEINKGEISTTRNVVISVKNNGAPPKGLTLEKFITKGHTTDSENGGMGMGGSFINKALQLMGGELTDVKDISQKAGEYNALFKFKLQLDD